MTLNFASLAWDASRPLPLARFWAAALGWEVSGEPHADVGLRPTDGTGFTFVFVPATGEKTGRNRIHLDLSSQSAEDQHATVARLAGLGASEIDIGQGRDAPHVVLADPEGNEFCVLEPGNKFVTYASRVGSLTCDGTRAVGYFWSQALGWPLVWDQDEETAIRAPDGAGQFITWGPPLAPKRGKNRLRFRVAPPPDGDQAAEVERLLSLGAKRIEAGPDRASSVMMADPDDNEFYVLTPR
jgi:catechol 2,3-dioxygenase-like lactoylglutathione lyase family enzyme